MIKNDDAKLQSFSNNPTGFPQHLRKIPHMCYDPYTIILGFFQLTLYNDLGDALGHGHDRIHKK
jgi:hypothetical protein